MLKQVDLDGTSRFSDALKVVENTTVIGDNSRQGAMFALGQNYPNPFNPTTRITFSVDKTGYTTLKVYNVLGEAVKTLFEGIAQKETEYNTAFDGSTLANGAYFYRLVNGNHVSLKKMVLVK